MTLENKITEVDGKIDTFDIHSWVEKHSPEILIRLENERQLLLAKWSEKAQEERNPRKRKDYEQKYLDTSYRVLSEMPLCRACSQIIIPPYYEVTVGEVRRRSGLISADSYVHTFIIGPNNQVLCFTFGQFSNSDREDLKPGQRIDDLKIKAPGLITTLPCGLSYLHGTTEEIRKQLGLLYKSYDFPI